MVNSWRNAFVFVCLAACFAASFFARYALAPQSHVIELTTQFRHEKDRIDHRFRKEIIHDMSHAFDVKDFKSIKNPLNETFVWQILESGSALQTQLVAQKIIQGAFQKLGQSQGAPHQLRVWEQTSFALGETFQIRFSLPKSNKEIEEFEKIKESLIHKLNHTSGVSLWNWPQFISALRVEPWAVRYFNVGPSQILDHPFLLGAHWRAQVRNKPFETFLNQIPLTPSPTQGATGRPAKNPVVLGQLLKRHQELWSVSSYLGQANPLQARPFKGTNKAEPRLEWHSPHPTGLWQLFQVLNQSKQLTYEVSHAWIRGILTEFSYSSSFVALVFLIIHFWFKPKRKDLSTTHEVSKTATVRPQFIEKFFIKKHLNYIAKISYISLTFIIFIHFRNQPETNAFSTTLRVIPAQVNHWRYLGDPTFADSKGTNAPTFVVWSPQEHNYLGEKDAEFKLLFNDNFSYIWFFGAALTSFLVATLLYGDLLFGVFTGFIFSLLFYVMLDFEIPVFFCYLNSSLLTMHLAAFAFDFKKKQLRFSSHLLVDSRLDQAPNWPLLGLSAGFLATVIYMPLFRPWFVLLLGGLVQTMGLGLFLRTSEALTEFFSLWRLKMRIFWAHSWRWDFRSKVRTGLRVWLAALGIWGTPWGYPHQRALAFNVVQRGNETSCNQEAHAVLPLVGRPKGKEQPPHRSFLTERLAQELACAVTLDELQEQLRALSHAHRSAGAQAALAGAIDKWVRENRKSIEDNTRKQLGADTSLPVRIVGGFFEEFFGHVSLTIMEWQSEHSKTLLIKKTFTERQQTDGVAEMGQILRHDRLDLLSKLAGKIERFPVFITSTKALDDDGLSENLAQDIDMLLRSRFELPLPKHFLERENFFVRTEEKSPNTPQLSVKIRRDGSKFFASLTVHKEGNKKRRSDWVEGDISQWSVFQEDVVDSAQKLLSAVEGISDFAATMGGEHHWGNGGSARLFAVYLRQNLGKAAAHLRLRTGHWPRPGEKEQTWVQLGGAGGYQFYDLRWFSADAGIAADGGFIIQNQGSESKRHVFVTYGPYGQVQSTLPFGMAISCRAGLETGTTLQTASDQDRISLPSRWWYLGLGVGFTL